MKQAQQRSEVRMKQGRASLLDYIVRNLSYDKIEDDENQSEIEETVFNIDDNFFLEPQTIFTVCIYFYFFIFFLYFYSFYSFYYLY